MTNFFGDLWPEKLHKKCTAELILALLPGTGNAVGEGGKYGTHKYTTVTAVWLVAA